MFGDGPWRLRRSVCVWVCEVVLQDGLNWFWNLVGAETRSTSDSHAASQAEGCKHDWIHKVCYQRVQIKWSRASAHALPGLRLLMMWRARACATAGLPVSRHLDASKATLSGFSLFPTLWHHYIFPDFCVEGFHVLFWLHWTGRLVKLRDNTKRARIRIWERCRPALTPPPIDSVLENVLKLD